MWGVGYVRNTCRNTRRASCKSKYGISPQILAEFLGLKEYSCIFTETVYLWVHLNFRTKTRITAVHTADRLLFVIGTQCIFCEAGSEFVNAICINLMLQCAIHSRPCFKL
jgi:hypothetical protein